MRSCSKICIFLTASCLSLPSVAVNVVAEPFCDDASADRQCSLHLLQASRTKRRRGEIIPGPSPKPDIVDCKPTCGTSVATFNYARAKDWGSEGLYPGNKNANSTCFLGGRQSPINIVPLGTSPLVGEKFSYSYSPVPDTFVANNGHYFQANLSGGGFITGAETDEDGKPFMFYIDSYHIHAPAEHRINGLLPPAEIHIVHSVLRKPHGEVHYLNWKEQEKLKMKGGGPGPKATSLGPYFTDAVVGIILDIGLTTNPCVKQLLMQPFPQVSCTNCIGTVDLAKCFKKQLNGKYWWYDGSLTTPGCNERVQWQVMQTRATISLPDFFKFKTMGFNFPANNRPVQPINGRPVFYAKSAGAI